MTRDRAAPSLQRYDTVMRWAWSLVVVAGQIAGCGSAAPIGEPQFPGKALEPLPCGEAEANPAGPEHAAQLVVNNRTPGERLVFRRFPSGAESVVAVVPPSKSHLLELPSGAVLTVVAATEAATLECRLALTTVAGPQHFTIDGRRPVATGGSR